MIFLQKIVRLAFFILIALVLVLQIAIADTRTIVFSDGRHQPLQVIEVGGKDYTTLDQIGKTLFKSYTISNQKGIIIGSYTLKFANSSFFVVKDISGDIDVAQMLLPAIDYNSNLLIPVNQFFTTLETFKLYNVQFDGKKILLSKFSKKANDAADLTESKTINYPKEEKEQRPDEYFLQSKIVIKSKYDKNQETDLNNNTTTQAKSAYYPANKPITGGDNNEYKTKSEDDTEEIFSSEIDNIDSIDADNIDDSPDAFSKQNESKLPLNDEYSVFDEPNESDNSSIEFQTGSDDNDEDFLNKMNTSPISDSFYNFSFELNDGIKAQTKLRNRAKSNAQPSDKTANPKSDMVPNSYRLPKNLKRSEIDK